MEIPDPIFQIPDSNNTKSQKTGGGSAPVMRIQPGLFPRHRTERAQEAQKIINKAASSRKPALSVGNKLFYEVQFDKKALSKSAQPRALLDKSHIDVYAQISERTFLVSSTSANLTSFENSIKRLTLENNKNDSAYLSAISKIRVTTKKEKLTFTPDKNQLRAYLFLADVLSEEEGRGIATNIKEKTSTQAEYFVSESGAKVIYGSFGKDFIDEISTPDPRNPIVRIEKSIDFYASEELPTEYDYNSVKVENPELDAKVAVVDSGVFSHPLFKDLIINTEDHIKDISKEDLSHGTFVAGRTIFGHDIENQVRTLQSLAAKAKILDVKVLKGNGGGATDKEILDALLSVITNPNYKDIKVFNLSLSKPNDTSLRTGVKSFFTREIDSIAYKYKVCLIVAAGNHHVSLGKNYPDGLRDPAALITSPGDTVNGFSVGSVADTESSRSLARILEPSPFSRVGLQHQRKPDLVHFGGNCDTFGNCGGIGVKSFSLNPNKLFEGVGTSYAAPLVSGIAAQIYAYLKTTGRDSIDLTKALLLHSAKYTSPLTSRISTNELGRFVGFGIPDFDKALNCAQSSATFFYTGHITVDSSDGDSKEYKHRLKFIIPTELAPKGKATRVRGTLVYMPLISELGLKDYTLADIEVNLHYKNSKGNDKSAGLTSNSDDYRHKWNTVKTFEKTFSNTGRANYSAGDWEVWLTLTARGKADIKDYAQDYALIITIEDVSPDPETRLNLSQLIREQYPVYLPITQRVQTRVQV